MAKVISLVEVTSGATEVIAYTVPTGKIVQVRFTGGACLDNGATIRIGDYYKDDIRARAVTDFPKHVDEFRLGNKTFGSVFYLIAGQSIKITHINLKFFVIEEDIGSQ